MKASKMIEVDMKKLQQKEILQQEILAKDKISLVFNEDAKS